MKRNFRKLIASFLIAIMILSVTIPCYSDGISKSSGYSFLKGNSLSLTADAASVDSLNFVLNADGNSYCVHKCNSTASGAMIIPATYNGKPVTSISVSAFSYCKKLTSITIPDTITEIPNEAFSYCEKLTSIVIPDSVTSIGSHAFLNTGIYNNSANWDNGVLYIGKYLIVDSFGDFENDFYDLKDYAIKPGTVCIANSAFSNCVYLKSVSIPNTVKYIGDGAFRSCSGITEFILPDSIETIGNSAFEACRKLSKIEIPASVVKIDNRAFYNCPLLKSINVSSENPYFSSADGVLYNKSKTLIIKYPCTKSGAYVFPDSVTEIAETAFSYCEELTAVTFSNGLKEISAEAFSYCTALSSVVIPNGVTKINNGAFSYCSKLKSITIPDSVTSIENIAFENTAFSKNTANWVNGVLYIGKFLIKANAVNAKGINSIKPGTICIADRAFYWADKLTKVIIPNTVTHIGDTAFMNCTSLTDVTFSNGIKSIGDFAFCGCIKLLSAYIPQSNSFIGEAALGYSNPDYKVSGFKIFGYSGSVAQTYSKSNKITFVSSKPGLTGLKSISNTSGGLKINWSSVTGAAGYYVYRKTSKGWSKIATVNSNITSYTDKNAKSGNTYKYTVKAYNPFGNGTYSSKGISNLYLSQPKVSVKNISKGINISWGKIPGATGYLVYRKAGNASSWSRIATIKKNSTVSFTDKNVKNGAVYTYTVKAYYGKVYSSYTSGISIKFLLAPKLVSATSSKSGITFKWSKVSSASGYVIYRKTGSGGWAKLATVKGNSTVSYLDKSAKKGVTYTYTVRAYNGKSMSTYYSGIKCKDKY